MLNAPDYHLLKTQASPDATNPFLPLHIGLLACLCIVDMIFNSSVEFGDLTNEHNIDSSNGAILVM
ncbi:hypothetical protein PINS_up007316 [Pythium insidiosum]|nr:hypothetical protein PINS_up007316 [Pythium insidiosum]